MTLSGCGTFSRPSAPGSTPPARGGYYLDDGPGANPPANLDDIADAVPRPEPINRATTRPYTVMGRNYTPLTELTPYRERGLATWYGRRYHGKPTSSGEPYDMYRMTAAHTTLPIPSYVRVTNIDNGRSVVVRINDRGPFIGERLIDLSYVAAHKLDIVRNGAALVEVESVLPGVENTRSAHPGGVRTTARTEAANALAPRPREQAPVISDATGLYLQLAAFSLKENAERFVERIRAQLDGVTPVRIVAAGALYRIHAGPYPDRGSAEQAAGAIAGLLGAAPLVVAPH